MSQDNEDRIDQDLDNRSFWSYTRMHGDKMFIARNNLKLCIVINLALYTILVITSFTDWYCLEGDVVSSKVSADINIGGQ